MDEQEVFPLDAFLNEHFPTVAELGNRDGCIGYKLLDEVVNELFVAVNCAFPVVLEQADVSQPEVSLPLLAVAEVQFFLRVTLCNIEFVEGQCCVGNGGDQLFVVLVVL